MQDKKQNYLIDFHAHILPGVDHGCDCLQTALAQLTLAETAGIGSIVSTSHFYPDRIGASTFCVKRDEALHTLKHAYHGPIHIASAAEVFLCEGLENFPNLQALAIENTKYILIEMPPPPWSARLNNTLQAIMDIGFFPVLAHIDRYPQKNIDELLRMGVLAQINPSGILRFTLKRRMLQLINAGVVVALGSDIHNANAKCYRKYLCAMRCMGSMGDIIQQAMYKIIN